MFVNNTNRIDNNNNNPFNKSAREVKSEMDKDRDANGVYIPARKKNNSESEDNNTKNPPQKTPQKNQDENKVDILA